MKVHLRQRKQGKKGSISLYLEIYKGTATTADGKVKNLRDYEYLNLYLIEKPKSPIDKESNKKTLELANSIKAKRELEIKNGIYGFNSDFKSATNFITYFNAQAEKRKQSEGNYGNWDSTAKWIVKYSGNQVRFKDINADYCEGFKNYLTNQARTSSNKPLSSASASSYFNKFKACLKQAVKDKILQSNPCDDIDAPKVIESIREYLTLDEVRAAAKIECRYDVLKRAFLFSCLTGCRWSDVQKLEWSEVQKLNDGWRIVFHQKKTKGLQYLDISDQARELLGQTGAPDERVFTGLKYSSYSNVELSRWLLKAGITKKITFHCGRHTFAVLQLSLGTEIYTLSKLLGHSELRTTQIYAKIIDEKKREAVNKIPSISL